MRETRPGQHDVAIIGMACLFPGAPGLDAYWRNILGKVDAVSDPPADAWDPALHYDPTSADTDRVYCKRGGYLGPLAYFDPLAHGIAPMAVGGEPDQWLALQLARDALDDAGYRELDPRVRLRTAVVLGKGTYLNHGNLSMVQHGLVVTQTVELLRTLHPEYTDRELETIRTELKRRLPAVGPEVVSGLIPNVIVGRIANRLDLMGPTYTVDAACASSLVATQIAVRDLASGAVDLALVGGSQVSTPVPILNVFCQLNALSHREEIRPFDEGADGTLLGEGIGMVVLKRLADAERDGDRIYAVIKGVGIASDGRGVGVMAPRVEGEEMALRRAYEAAGVEPDTVELVEAHGTGTPVGDVVEIQALSRVFGPRKGELPTVAVGTVKSMISHTMPAAGIAGIIKAALSLRYAVLPPTLNVEKPNPKLGLEATPFYLNTETRPWIHGRSTPRRAAVNAFGFGGINGHVVLQEYRPPMASPETGPAGGHMPHWETEVCLLQSASRESLLEDVCALSRFVSAVAGGSDGADVSLADIAATLAREAVEGPRPVRLAIVADSLEDLRRKLEKAAGKLADERTRQIKDPAGIYYFDQPLAQAGKVVAVFPGEGSQYPSMLSDLCVHLPDVRAAFDEADRVLAGDGTAVRPSQVVFPPTHLPESERAVLEQRIWQMDSAVDTVLAANHGLWLLARRLGFRPDALVGHSTGEFSALRAAGVLDVSDPARLRRFALDLRESYERASEQHHVPTAAMLAVGASRETVEELMDAVGREGLHLGMDNCPHQAVIIGEATAIERARAEVQRRGLMFELLPFDRPYHTPQFEPYAAYLRATFRRARISAAEIPVWSCTSVGPYPSEPAAVRSLAIRHWVEPVEFRRTIEQLHADGARLFVEVGARGNLSSFIDDILRGKDGTAVPLNVQRRSGIAQLCHGLALLLAHGVDLSLTPLFADRPNRHVVWRNGVEAPASSASRRKLMTGFPFLRLSPEFARSVREASSTSHIDGSAGEVPTATAATVADASQTVGRISDATEVGAYQPAAADQKAGPDAVMTSPAKVAAPSGAISPGLADPDGAGGVFSSYLQTMDRFLATQERVLRTYLGEATGSALLQSTALPLLGRVVMSEPGELVVAERTFDPVEDRYLRDHTLGRSISEADPDLLALAVMPLTMSMEILAETARFLRPDWLVVGMRDVLANRWIAFDGTPQALQVSARRLDEDADGVRVAVQLRNLTEDEQSSQPAPSPVIQATVLLAPRYASKTTAPSIQPGGPVEPSIWQSTNLYEEAMFHGPLWRGVESVDWVGQDFASARFRVLPFDGFLRSQPDVAFTLDPVTLDAAGQAIGFWVNERFPTLKQIFPFRVSSLEVNGPQRPAGEALTCQARIREIDDRRVVSDIEILDASGDVWMRLVGWEDKRFSASLRLHPLVFDTRQAQVSYEWPAAVRAFDGAADLECRVVVERLTADRDFWKKVWAYCVLAPGERERFLQLRTPEPDQVSWLAARTAAKEAVRALLVRKYGFDVPSADVEILADERGRPVVGGAWTAWIDGAPVVSLSHLDGVAVALAAIPPVADATLALGVGVDVEVVQPRSEGFIELALSTEERRLLSAQLPPDAHVEWLHRFWCAKEAVGKALGYGLPEGPSSVVVRAFDPDRGLLELAPAGQLAGIFPEAATEGLQAYTHRENDLVVATTVFWIGRGVSSVYR